MGRHVSIIVGKRGRVKADFVGFPGDDCYDESESLQKALAHYGLKAGKQELQPKSSEEIERELEALSGEASQPAKASVPGRLRRGSS